MVGEVFPPVEVVVVYRLMDVVVGVDEQKSILGTELPECCVACGIELSFRVFGEGTEWVGVITEPGTDDDELSAG